MRIAVVHDWLVTYAGAERVTEQILACFPEADLFCVVDFLPNEQRGFLRGKTPHPTFLQRLPFARTKYRSYLPLMPRAVERLDLSGYDLVLSSSHAVAKGVKTAPEQLHISYVHSPMRYAWDLQAQYLRETGLDHGLQGKIVRWLLRRMRNWDAESAVRVNRFIANSRYIAARIENCYGRKSTVIYPPVSIRDFECVAEKEDYYVTVSRLVPYKKVDLIVEAFSQMPEKRLRVIGDGPDLAKIRKKAASNVELLGARDFAFLKTTLQKARAFVFAAEEDFGISVVEAQACGTPVIAFGRGGALETVRDFDQPGATGVFFEKQSIDSLIRGLQCFEEVAASLLPANCRTNAERFSVERFCREYRDFVETSWEEFQGSF